MQHIVRKILTEYTHAKNESFAGHPLSDFVRNEIPQLIYETSIVSTQDYIVK